MYPMPHGSGPGRRRKLWPVITAIVTILVGCGMCSVGGMLGMFHASKDTTTSLVPAGGKAAENGLVFVVEQMDCTATSVGSSVLTRRAQGRFCVVRLAVTNQGTKAQTFVSSWQKGMDGQGREYVTDNGAELLITPDPWISQINPGSTMRGVKVAVG